MRGRDVGENLRAVDGHVEVLQDGKVKRGKRNSFHLMGYHFGMLGDS